MGHPALIKIKDFSAEYAGRAARLVRERYRLERLASPALPAELPLPDLGDFAQNGLGVAALDGVSGELAGFLCGVGPFEKAFGSTQAVGVFSPMHANAARGRGHGELYARLLEGAQDRWMRAGAASHALCLCAHDEEAQRACFACGFGMRCFDAVRPMAGIESPPRPPEGVRLARVEAGAWEAVYPLYAALGEHMAGSPCFIRRACDPPEAFAAAAARESARCFAAFEGGRAAAFLSCDEHGGETVVAASRMTQNITGAYCLPEYRGSGLFPALLDFAARAMAAEGYERLGVDGESINPAALRFWPKYFQVYTHSVTRRIDEDVLDGRRGS